MGFFVFTFSCLVGSLLLGEIAPISIPYQECVMLDEIVRIGLLVLAFIAIMIGVVWLKHPRETKVVTSKSLPRQFDTAPDDSVVHVDAEARPRRRMPRNPTTWQPYPLRSQGFWVPKEGGVDGEPTTPLEVVLGAPSQKEGDHN